MTEWVVRDLTETVAAEAPVYVFADTSQRRHDGVWTIPFAHIPFPLVENCRNTRPIHERAAEPSDEADAHAEIPGAGPEMIVWKARGARSRWRCRGHRDPGS